MKLVIDARDPDAIIWVEGQKYTFLPNNAGFLVCEVNDDGHAGKLLGGALPISVYSGPDDAVVEAAIDAEESEEEDDGFGESVVDATQEERIAAASVKYAEMTMEELQAIHAERYGKVASVRTKHEALVKKLATADATAP